MTSHRDAYRQLKHNDTLFEQIRVVEESMGERGGFFYLPKDKIQAAVSAFRTWRFWLLLPVSKGLILPTPALPLAGDTLTFIHASSSRGEVVVDQNSLNDYCAAQPSCTGVIIARML